MQHSRSAIEGCLLGCAVGDSICLPYEGIKPGRLRKFIRFPLKHRFIFGCGMVSDDTDHSVFVAQAISRSAADPDLFARIMAKYLRYWLLCLPAGIGLATLRSILKLWFGSSPSSSGVFSAGNGAAMRSAIIGVIHCEDSDLRNRFIKASTVITHTDPKALFGARVVADLAAFATRNRSKPNMDELRNILVNAGEGGEWAEAVRQTMLACESGNIEAAVSETGFSRGISGYILHTLPVAVSSWYIHHGNFRKTIETIVSLGGDTDTVAAIAGSLAGISSGRDGIPDNWISGIADYPHGVGFISGLSDDLSEGRTSSRGFSWMLLPRGIVFTVLVLGHGFRRLLPPY